LRQNAPSVTENLDGFVVEIVSALDGTIIYTSGDVFPVDNNAATTTTQDFSATVTYPAGGDYILRFTEITLAGGSSGGGVIIDDVSMLVCFLRGTSIETKNGTSPVEDLSVGDLIVTEGHGLQPIRWIGSTNVKTTAKLYPVRILAGALGSKLPKRDLLVSRQHRFVMSSPIAKRMFGHNNVLISAIQLTKLPGIFVDDSFAQAEYFHMMFDQHEIVFAEGTQAESLYAGPEALKAISSCAREEILTLFPELKDLDYAPKSAMPIPKPAQQKKFIERHIRKMQRS
jgi:hypothetical protein